MVFSEQMVVVVKVNGKIMREQKDVIKLPFGTEYSLLFKNLNTKKAVVRVDIDGTDVLDGDELVINGNSKMELKRFIVGGNMSEGPRFKFIEKTEKISDHRGDKIDDGIIRIEWQYENPTCRNIFSNIGNIREVHHYHHNNWPTWDNGSGQIVGNIQTQVNTSQTFSANVNNEPVANCCLNNDSNMFNTGMSNAVKSAEVNEAGITVKGSECDQVFHSTSIGLLEVKKHTLCLKLIGTNDSGELIQKPVIVSRKKKCSTCGKSNSSRMKYCGECGTNLDW